MSTITLAANRGRRSASTEMKAQLTINGRAFMKGTFVQGSKTRRGDAPIADIAGLPSSAHMQCSNLARNTRAGVIQIRLKGLALAPTVGRSSARKDNLS